MGVDNPVASTNPGRMCQISVSQLSTAISLPAASIPMLPGMSCAAPCARGTPGRKAGSAGLPRAPGLKALGHRHLPSRLPALERNGILGLDENYPSCLVVRGLMAAIPRDRKAVEKKE